jgi:hypothetical protein
MRALRAEVSKITSERPHAFDERIRSRSYVINHIVPLIFDVRLKAPSIPPPWSGLRT